MGYVVGILLVCLLFELARLFIDSLNKTNRSETIVTTTTPLKKRVANPKTKTPPPPAKPAASKRTTASARKATGNSQDDLTKIEGVGPKIAKVLTDSGMRTYIDLTKADIASLEKIIKEGGVGFRQSVASTWAEQAKLAAAGKWEVLDKLQEDLKGGVGTS